MASQSDSGQDLVTVCTDATDGGTLVRVVAPSRHIRMVDLMPVFEALDLNLVSYTAERDPDANWNGSMTAQQAPLGRRKHSFRGRFLVTDADGHNLSDALLDGLVAALQEALHVRLSRATRCSALHEESRRGSVASYATDASVDPDSPSFAAAAAAHQGQGNPLGGAHGGHGFSHLNPAAQFFSSREPQQPQPQTGHHPLYAHPPYPHPHQHLQQQLAHPGYPQHHHHEHTVSAGSMALSEQSVSSIGSLFRAPSGAASDHPMMPSPPIYSRHDTGIASSSLMLMQQQQQLDTALVDTPPHSLAAGPGLGPAAGAGSATNGATGADGERTLMPPFGAVTPFGSIAAVAYDQQQHPHHQHSFSQPHSESHGRACDIFELGATPLTLRAASVCSTPPHMSGPLTLLPITTASAPDSGAEPGHSGPVPSVSAPGHLPAPSRPGHVSFCEPGPSSTAATTPLHSPPPSASPSFISAATATGSLPPPIASACAGPSSQCSVATSAAGDSAATVGRACGVAGCGLAGCGVEHGSGLASAALLPGGFGRMPGPGPGSGPGGGGAGGAGTSGGADDGSPTSSVDDRDGSYTWWSTFTAQDTVARIMSHPARSISAEADLGQAKSLMTKHNISALLVNTGNSPPGFITKRDFLKVQFNKNFKRTKVKDVMTQPVISVDINLPIEQCSRVLEANGVRRVLVYDASRASDSDPLSAFVGVVSDADLFKCMGAPAMSPVLGSMANSMEHSHQQGYGVLPAGAASLPPMPSLPSLPSMPATAPSQPLPGTPCQGLNLPRLHPQQHQEQRPQYPQQHPQQQPQQQQQQQGHPQQQHHPHQPQHCQQPLQHLQQQQPNMALSSAASNSSVSVCNSAAPSHAASMAGALSVGDAPAGSGIVAAALTLAGSGGSVVRLNAEASLADRYRCAAALWELDFSELEVTRRIGEGSFGEVLLASFRGTKVAVKRLRGFDVGPDNPDTGAPGETGPSPTQMPIFRQFFEREIEILATIRHPNVVNFIGACHTPPNVCLVTEYCARGSLDHLLHKSSIPLDLLKKVEFSMDIARGMSCLHSQKPPIIHRDLKTANLLVSARFEVKVADFGLSRIKDHAQLINSRAGLEGTVEYAAPEVLRGEPYTEKCDIWSYSILLWEIIHRQRPYADADVPIYILMMSLGNGTLRLPPVREDVATPGLARLVERCMAWHPTERPSFREVLHALEAEYKILRGKAAAVPRSDSASSMMVLPGTQNRQGGTPSDSAAAAAGQHPSGAAATATPAEHQHLQARAQPPQHHPAPPPQQHPRRPAAPVRKSSKLGLNPHGNGNPHAPGVDASGGAGWRGPADSSSPFAADATLNGAFWDQPDYLQPPHQHQQQQRQQQQHQQQQPATTTRPRVKLSLPQGAAGGPADAPDPVSPADSSSRPSSSRTAGTSTTGRTGAAGGGSKPGSAGRSTGRSLRSAARSKSMPLPEFEWFAAEEGMEDFVDTTDSMADEECDAAGSTATSASGATAAGVQSLDRGGVHSTPYPDATSFRPADADDVAEVGGSDAVTAAATPMAAAGPLPHHLIVRVRRNGGDDSSAASDPGHGSAPLGLAAGACRPQVSAFAAAAAMVVEEGDEEEGDEGQAWTGAQRAGEPAPVEVAAMARRPSLRLHTAAAAAAASAALGRVTFVASCAGTAAPQQSPFHAAANSPFANAADMPWSPRDGDDVPASLTSRFSTRSADGAAAALAPLAQQEQDLAATAPAAAPPRRVAFVSPFAQLASEPPALRSRDEDEEEDGNVGRGVNGGSSGGAGAGAARAFTALASTSNSTDVSTVVEKDQRASIPDPSWAMLGSCSKPPSGDVYGNGNGPSAAAAANRLSPSVRPASPPTLAAVYAAAQRASPMAVSGGDDEHDSEEAAARVAVLSQGGGSHDGAAAVAAGEQGAMVVASEDDEELRRRLQEEEQQLLLADVAALGFAATALPVLPVEALLADDDDDQFDDEEDEDAALHTTAWVRL